MAICARTTFYLLLAASILPACGGADNPGEGQPTTGSADVPRAGSSAPDHQSPVEAAVDAGAQPANAGSAAPVAGQGASDAAGSSASAASEHPAVLDGPRAFLADAGDGWLSLTEGAWELPASSEGYRCVRFTLPQDLYVNAFRPMIPLGTHHTVLTVADDVGQPDGVTTCGAGTNAPNGVFGSGVGTGDFEFPAGVAVHLRKGQQLLLNLHLFNASEAPLTGVSGTLLKQASADEVQNVAEVVLGGPVGFNIPAGGQSVTTGQCTMDHDITLFAVSPHMHQLGVHLKAIADSSLDGEQVIFDGPYDFDSQLAHPIEPVQMKAGDVVRIECTYDNTTDHAVGFGDSSLDEMCFAGLYRYPAGGPFLCTH